MKDYPAIEYIPPRAKKKEYDLPVEDADWEILTKHDIKLSFESVGGLIILYLDDGTSEDEGGEQMIVVAEYEDAPKSITRGIQELIKRNPKKYGRTEEGK